MVRPTVIFSSSEDAINYSPVAATLEQHGQVVVALDTDEILNGSQQFVLEMESRFPPRLLCGECALIPQMLSPRGGESRSGSRCSATTA